jgi:ParB-like chromosome segregation protein Spo0J
MSEAWGTNADWIKDEIKGFSDQEKIDYLEDLKIELQEMHPIQQPVGQVMWVDIDRVQANDYNPNSVAGAEMKLLYTSIKHDGYTQPVVTIYDEELDKFVIVDGFHRYFTCKSNQDIRDRNHGRLPIGVIEKDINERMAATVRHNRARGSHSVDGMANMVFSMLEQGWKDADICNHLGMEPEELLRLKHITGFSKLFENTEYKKAWVTKQQILIKKKYQDEQEI